MGRRRINFREGGATSRVDAAIWGLPPPQDHFVVLTLPHGEGSPHPGLCLAVTRKDVRMTRVSRDLPTCPAASKPNDIML